MWHLYNTTGGRRHKNAERSLHQRPPKIPSVIQSGTNNVQSVRSLEPRSRTCRAPIRQLCLQNITSHPQANTWLQRVILVPCLKSITQCVQPVLCQGTCRASLQSLMCLQSDMTIPMYCIVVNLTIPFGFEERNLIPQFLMRLQIIIPFFPCRAPLRSHKDLQTIKPIIPSLICL